MSPSPISIPSRSSSESPSVTSSPTSSTSSSSHGLGSGLYVPVHKRTSSTPKSTRTLEQRTLPIYTPAEMFNLAQSPLTQQVSTSIREPLSAFPELVMSKRQKRSLEYLEKQRASTQSVLIVTPRRRPVGRVPDRSRRNAAKIVDQASWRGRRLSIVPLPIAV